MIKIITDKWSLRKVCTPVLPEDLSNIKMQLAVAMRQQIGKGYAVSANQIGIQKRAFVMHMGAQRLTFFVNPKLLSKEGEQFEHSEGCLSLPREGNFTVARWPRITVTDDMHGEQTLSALSAVIWQHEMDHLDGILICDKEIE